MTDLTTACSALPRSLRQRDRRDLVPAIARSLSWIWLRWRRGEIIRTLEKVDDRLLLDAGIERSGIEDIVDALIARWR